MEWVIAFIAFVVGGMLGYNQGTKEKAGRE